MTMYDRIKWYRKAMGLSQEELAKRTGYTDRSSIAKIESGMVDIPRSKIQAFADVFGISPSYLMDGDEETPTELSAEESALLELFRSLPADKQTLALEMIRFALSMK